MGLQSEWVHQTLLIILTNPRQTFQMTNPQNANSSRSNHDQLQNIFRNIKPFTTSISKEISSASDHQAIYPSLLHLNRFILHHSTFHPSIIHYTIYPIQHLLSFFSSSSALPDSSLRLSLQIIHHLLSNSNQTKPIALIQQESQLLESLLDLIITHHSNQDATLLIIDSIKFILNQYHQIPIQFIKPIFKSILDLFSILSSDPIHHPSTSIALIDLIQSSLLKLSTSQSDHQSDQIRLITTLLPRSVSDLVKLIITQSSFTKLLIRSIDLLQWLVLFCLDENLNDIGLLLDLSSQTKSPSSSEQSSKASDHTPSQVLIVRDLQWFRITTSNLINLFQLLSTSLTFHSNLQIQESWSKFSMNVLQRIPNLLSSNIIQKLSISLILYQHEPINLKLIQSHPIEFGKASIGIIKQNFKLLCKLMIYKDQDEDQLMISYCDSIVNSFETLWILFQNPSSDSHQSLIDEILDDVELVKSFQIGLKSIELKLLSIYSVDSLIPNLIGFKNIHNHKVIKSFQNLIQSFGKGLCLIENGNLQLKVYEYLFNLIFKNDQENQSLNSIWILIELINGTNKFMNENHPIGKQTQKRIESFLKRLVLELIEEFEQPDQSNHTFKNQHQEIIKEEPEMITTVIYQKGINSLPELDKLRPLIKSNSSEIQETQHVLRISLFLGLISTISIKLNTSFQPLLSRLLYPILRYLDHPILSTQLFIVLERISYETCYGNLKNMISDQLDYLVDSISRKLSPNRILPDFKATTVMVNLIELIGVNESFGILGESLVIEIGEALRDFHLIDEFLESVLDGYLRVLKLVGKVVSDYDSENLRFSKNEDGIKANEEERDLDGLDLFIELEKKRRSFLELVLFRDCKEEEKEEMNEKEELDRFKEWYDLRQKVLNVSEKEENEIKFNPGLPFHREEEVREEEVQEEEVLEKPIGLFERVTILIVSQSLPFITHKSIKIQKKVKEILKISLNQRILKTEEKVIPLLNQFKSFIRNDQDLMNCLRNHETFKIYFLNELRNPLKLEKSIWDGFEKRKMDLVKYDDEGDEKKIENGFELNYEVWKLIRNEKKMK